MKNINISLFIYYESSSQECFSYVHAYKNDLFFSSFIVLYCDCVSGLDPAEPDFENHPASIRVDQSDAQFVDIIHTNGAAILSGGAGLMQASGHVDFYVNGGEFQTGCDDLGGTLNGLLHFHFSGKVIDGY